MYRYIFGWLHDYPSSLVWAKKNIRDKTTNSVLSLDNFFLFVMMESSDFNYSRIVCSFFVFQSTVYIERERNVVSPQGYVNSFGQSNIYKIYFSIIYTYHHHPGASSSSVAATVFFSSSSFSMMSLIQCSPQKFVSVL